MPSKWDQYAVDSTAPSGGGKWDKYAAADSPPAPTSGPIGGIPEPAQLKQGTTTGQDLADTGYDLAAGVAKGPLSDMKNVGRMVSPSFMSSVNTEPSNTTQAVAKGGEQIGEFMIPGGAEEKLAMKGAEMLPRVGGLARMAVKAGTGGLINKVQGGDFSTGAAGGAAGEGMIQAAKGLAPHLAEGALGIRRTDRAYGRTPGESILNETTGVRPGTVAASAQQRMGELNPELEQAVSNSRSMASLNPARQVVGDAANTAANQNAQGLFDQLGKQSDFLSYGGPTGDVTPRKLLDLKRGFGEEHTTWNPDVNKRALNTARNAYGAMDKELDRVVPESAGLNQRISSLIPVARRAESAELGAPVGQRVLHRVAAHTGAGLLGAAGATAGAHEGGTPGAVVGGALGLVAPELLASPTGQMIMAVTLAGRGAPAAINATRGGLLQLNRKNGGSQ